MAEATKDVALSKTVLEQFAKMASALEAYPAGGLDSILTQIFEATSLDDYNKIFEGDRGLPLDTNVQISRVRYAPTDYPGGLPFYLVCDGVNLKTGEAKEFTVGATVVVGTLVRAAFNEHLPCRGFMYEAPDETKAGFTAYNWKMLEINTGQEMLPNAK